MKTLAFAAATLAVAAAAFTGSASAAGPYQFSNRALFEKTAARNFEATIRPRGRYRVRSIGCAKGGAGRAFCAVVADGPVGIESFAFTFTCPSDRGVNCTGRVNDWPLR